MATKWQASPDPKQYDLTYPGMAWLDPKQYGLPVAITAEQVQILCSIKDLASDWPQAFAIGGAGLNRQPCLKRLIHEIE